MIPRQYVGRDRPREGALRTGLEPLRDPSVFKQFQIHPEFHTLTWPNGADFALEFLYDTIRVTA